MYISFCGNIKTPISSEILEEQYPVIENQNGAPTGFRHSLDYAPFATKDSLTVYVARVQNSIGHMVADCPAAGWHEDTFCFLDEDGAPVKEDDFNPNPVPQLI